MEPYLKAIPFFGYHETRIWLPTGKKDEDELDEQDQELVKEV
jgi:hypothetical protein